MSNCSFSELPGEYRTPHHYLSFAMTAQNKSADERLEHLKQAFNRGNNLCRAAAASVSFNVFIRIPLLLRITLGSIVNIIAFWLGAMTSFRSPELFLRPPHRDELPWRKTCAIPDADLSAVYSVGHRA